MKLLVTGGAGYIGSHVVLACLEKGHEITVYDNLSSGCRENLFRECVFVEADILDTDTLNDVMARGFDGIIHLAAFKAAGESMIVPGKYATNNINGTVNILNTAYANGIRTVVFSSSAAVYGEPQYLPIDEKHATEPGNFYGFTKLVIEGLLSWYDRLKTIRYASLRYFNAAGYDPKGRIHGLEKNPANLLPIIMEVAVGKRNILEIFGDDYDTPDGTCIRDYIHVTDLADAHVKAIDYIAGNDESLIVNLGSGMGISVMEMYETAEKVTGKNIPSKITGRRPGDPAVLFASSDYAGSLLGWKTSLSDIKTLIESTWNVYQSVFEKK
ncbi:MAG: UDP-glucose 4-epimerase GalE [Spirochaetales bacterium]|nr:UDP-glucose 4-epimerase GalE [Spirochaetales bacterium]